MSPARTLKEAMTWSAVSVSVVSRDMKSMKAWKVTIPLLLGSTTLIIRLNSASPWWERDRGERRAHQTFAGLSGVQRWPPDLAQAHRETPPPHGKGISRVVRDHHGTSEAPGVVPGFWHCPLPPSALSHPPCSARQPPRFAGNEKIGKGKKWGKKKGEK